MKQNSAMSFRYGGCEDIKGGRFACSIRPKKPESLPFFYNEGVVFDCDVSVSIFLEQ